MSGRPDDDRRDDNRRDDGVVGIQPVSTPPLTGQAGQPGQQWSGVPATSSAVPVSSAPMASVAAPVSAAPAGMTVIAAAGSDLVGSDEAPTAYLQLPGQGSEPLGGGDHSPVSAPPDSGPPATGSAGTRHGAATAGDRAGDRVGDGAGDGVDDGSPTSGPPAGGATEAA